MIHVRVATAVFEAGVTSQRTQNANQSTGLFAEANGPGMIHAFRSRGDQGTSSDFKLHRSTGDVIAWLVGNSGCLQPTPSPTDKPEIISYALPEYDKARSFDQGRRVGAHIDVVVVW